MAMKSLYAVMLFLTILMGLLMLAGCEMTPYLMVSTDALSPRPIVSMKHPFDEADRQVFKMFKAWCPEEGEGQKLMFVDYPNLKRSYGLRPGGFALVKGPFDLVYHYFHGHHWELLPFWYHDRQVWRKPMRVSA